MKQTVKKMSIMAVAIICLFATTGFSQTNLSKDKKPTIVFVHSLWADGSAWNKVTASLQAEGFPVIAVQNATTSLEDDVAAANRAISRAEGDVILVGHSWGGFVISEAGVLPKVKALVYIAALVPDNGETIATLSEKAPATNLAKYLENNDGFITLSKEGVQKAFANDCTPKEQNLIFCTQPPASQTVFAAVAQNAAWKLKPSFYLVAKKDGAINPDLERLMAKRVNATTIEVNASHVPMISNPIAVLEIVKKAAEHK